MKITLYSLNLDITITCELDAELKDNLYDPLQFQHGQIEKEDV